MKAGESLWLLTERGQQYTSIQFAEQLQKWSNTLSGTLVLAIGGSYGFSESILSQAAGELSLSRLTFTHQMVRLILLEQLYRAGTILKGEGYHH